MIWNFNYNLAIRQATQIEEIAREMKSLANGKFSTAIATVDASWDGDTSNIFIRHCTETKQQITAKATELENLARRIRDVAKILKEAEDRARREIEIFSGGGSSGGGGRG